MRTMIMSQAYIKKMIPSNTKCLGKGPLTMKGYKIPEHVLQFNL